MNVSSDRIPQHPAKFFPIAVDQPTRISAEFVPNDRIVRNNGIGLLLKPTVPTVLVETPGARPVPSQWETGYLYVCFKKDVSAVRADELHSSLGSTVVRRSRQHIWNVVRLADGKTEAAALNEYRALPEVELAMLSYNAQTENLEPTEWENSSLPPQTYLRRTASPSAWDMTTGSYFPIVAIVDNNVDIFSFDIQENIFLNPDEIPVAVTRDVDCSLLETPLPLISTDTNGDGAITGLDMDLDGDGVVTLKDVNMEPVRSLHLAALEARMEALPTVISLRELIQPESPIPSAERATAVEDGRLRCGLWEDLVDGAPGNNLVDDIAGWDFVVDRNVPTSEVVLPGAAPRDGSAHGHQVSGIVAAVNNADSLFSADVLAAGYVGQTWRARILPIRVHTQSAPEGFPEGAPFGDQGIYHDGIAYAVSMGADVANMSFSLICTKGHIDPLPAAFACPDFTDKTTEYRQSLNVAGLIGSSTLVVVGPVNQPIDLDSTDVLDLPAELLLPNQINVGSVTLSDEYRKDRVSFGVNTYHISAPSQSMPVLAWGGAGTAFPGLPPNDGIDEEQAGNSLAAPQVSGTAALMLSVNNGLRGNPVELKRRILEAATRIPALESKVNSGRRLNVRAAVELAQEP